MDKPKSFRLTAETIEQIRELAELLKETELQIIQRSVKMLYSNRATVVEEDAKERVLRAKGQK